MLMLVWTLKSQSAEMRISQAYLGWFELPKLSTSWHEVSPPSGVHAVMRRAPRELSLNLLAPSQLCRRRLWPTQWQTFPITFCMRLCMPFPRHRNHQPHHRHFHWAGSCLACTIATVPSFLVLHDLLLEWIVLPETVLILHLEELWARTTPAAIVLQTP